MKTFTIQAYGNPGLYRDLQESIAEYRTKHRTVSGALRGLERAERKSREWGKSMGRWGGFEFLVDGVRLERDDAELIEIRMSDLSSTLGRPYRDSALRSLHRTLTEFLEP